MTSRYPQASRPQHHLVATLAFCLILFLTLPALAQEGGGATESAVSAEAAPLKVIQAIPASQISIKAEETDAVISSMADRHQFDEFTEHVRDTIPAMIGAYQDLLEDTEEALTDDISPRFLDDVNRRWHREDSRIEKWISPIRERAKRLDRDLEDLGNLNKEWSSTLAKGESDLPRPLLEVAQHSLDRVKSLQAEFDERRAEVLSIEGQLEQGKEIIEDAFELVNTAVENRYAGFLKLVARPLWKEFMDPPPRRQHLQIVKKAMHMGSRQLGEFARESAHSLIYLGLFFLGLIGVLLYLQRRLRTLELDIPHKEIATRILSRPISTGLVATITLVIWLFPEEPRIVDETCQILLLIPLYRIIPKESWSSLRFLLVALAILIPLGRLTEILDYLSLLQRLFLLAESLFAGYAIIRTFRKPSPRLPIQEFNWFFLVRIGGKLAVALLAVAVLANIIGAAPLALLLTRAVVLTGYLTILLSAIYRIIESIVWITLNTKAARKLRMIDRHGALVRRRLLSLVNLAIAILWVGSALSLLQILPLILHGLGAILTAEAKFGTVAISLGDVLAFMITIWASFLLSRFVRFLLDEDVLPRLTLPRGVPHAISISLHYAILMVGFLLAIAATGMDLSKFTLLAGAFGVGLGFGLQNVVNNFVSGLILIAERPVMPGDTIQMGTMAGEIKRIGMRSSTVRTWQGAEVIVPNGNLISNELINWTLSDRQRRLEFPVGVAYGSDTTRVIELMMAAATNHPDILEHPAPTVLFQGFGDSALEFELRAWTMRFDSFLRVRSEIYIAMESALKAADITIPFPQRDLHFKSMNLKPASTPEPAAESDAGEPAPKMSDAATRDATMEVGTETEGEAESGESGDQ